MSSTSQINFTFVFKKLLKFLKKKLRRNKLTFECEFTLDFNIIIILEFHNVSTFFTFTKNLFEGGGANKAIFFLVKKIPNLNNFENTNQMVSYKA